jgi:hypothetical protein
MITVDYWTDHVKIAAGSTSATSLLSKANDTGRSIKVIHCIACSSGAVSTEGISFYRVMNEDESPLYHDKAALTAKEVSVCQVPFILNPEECIKVTFDKPAAVTDLLELVVAGE